MNTEKAANNQPQHNLKGRFPFRLGTTSYIIPDDIIPNLHYLAPQVDDVELVLFESDEFSNIPTTDDVNIMHQLANSHGLTYTVHLPLDIHLGSTSEVERQASIGKCLRIMERMGVLDPFAWILHLHGDQRGEVPSADIAAWLSQNRRSLEQIIQATGSTRSICIETLDYNFDLVAEIVEELDLAVCLDIGHLILMNRSINAHFDRWLDRTRVIHLHGVRGTQDHVDISHLKWSLLDEIIGRLSRPSQVNRTVTIEVFGETDFSNSMEILDRRFNYGLSHSSSGYSDF